MLSRVSNHEGIERFENTNTLAKEESKQILTGPEPIKNHEKHNKREDPIMADKAASQ